MDRIKLDADVLIKIEGGSYYDRIIVKNRYCHNVEAWENSNVKARGNSVVTAFENSVVKAFENSVVKARENSVIEARGNVGVRVFSADVTLTLMSNAVCWVLFKGTSKKIKKISKFATIMLPDLARNWKWYKNNYPVELIGKSSAILYKAVHKKDGKYFSEYDRSFFYEIGKSYKEKNAPRSRGSCSAGLHVSGKSWAKSFGMGWANRALLKCEVLIKDILVCDDCDGKVRVSKIKILEEVAW